VGAVDEQQAAIGREWAAARADRRYDGAAVRALPGSVPVADAVAALLP
jgi:hypothetical protein